MRLTFSKRLESLGERLERIRSAFYRQFPDQGDSVWYVIDVFDTYMIIEQGTSQGGRKAFRAPYSIAEDGEAHVSSVSEWTEVEQIWTPVINKAIEIKSLMEDKAVVAGYGVVFGGKDLVGETFSAETDFMLDYVPSKAVLYDHGQNGAVKKSIIGMVSSITKDELGLWIEAELDRHNQYVEAVLELVKQKALGWSSGSFRQLAEKNGSAIKRWPIVEFSLTPTPAEYRTLGVSRVKSNSSFTAGESGSTGVAQIGALASRKQADLTSGVKTMNILEAIRQLVPDLSEEQAKQIAAILGLAGIEDPQAANDETMRSIDIGWLAGQLKSLGYSLSLPGQQTTKAQPMARPPYNFQPAATQKNSDQDPDKAVHSIYIKRFGGVDDAQKAILTDVVGKDFQQTIYEQNIAFAKYLRNGDRDLTTQEVKALKTQIFPTDWIVKMVGEMSITDVKATMVEAQGQLGGYAVPPNVQSNIITRQVGLTAVRSAGATVITLASGNSTEWPAYDGGDDRYKGNLRGEWGTETQSPNEKNAKTKMLDIPTHVYTYKVPMSQSLVEDASNLVSLVEQDIADTMAIDEDEVFLVGDGAGKPLGILPGGLNALSLTVVASGDASALTAAGVKKLKRGVATQYRKNAIWVGNSDTFGTIEAFTSTDGKFIFEDLSEEEKLLSRRVFESEVMPDIAANAFPLLFGDMSGYAIVERLGLSIVRFQDSNTGINKVEYHVRRRLGGRVIKPWLFAVQKVSAS